MQLYYRWEDQELGGKGEEGRGLMMWVFVKIWGFILRVVGVVKVFLLGNGGFDYISVF